MAHRFCVISSKNFVAEICWFLFLACHILVKLVIFFPGKLTYNILVSWQEFYYYQFCFLFFFNLIRIIFSFTFGLFTSFLLILIRLLHLNENFWTSFLYLNHTHRQKKHPITKHNKCQITSARQKGCISLMCSDRNPRKGKESPETLVMR